MNQTAPKQVLEQEAAADALVKELSAAPPIQQELPLAVPVEQPVETLSEEEKLYRKRYLSLKGMYDTQVPQYQEQIKFLQGLLAQAPQTPAPAPATPFAKVAIEPDEIRDYGEEFFDMVGRQAQIATQKGFDEVMNRLNQLEQAANTLYSGQANIQQNTFEDRLTSVVPNWREIDSNPGFLNWLDEVDPFAGESRLHMLRTAVSAGDPDRAARFFSTWAGTQQPQAQPQRPSPQQPAGLRSVATPTVSRQPDASASYAAGNSGRVYSQAEVQQFYSDIRRGKYIGREQEVSMFERDLQAAMQEGRVV